jgi:hypothetical protein
MARRKGHRYGYFISKKRVVEGLRSAAHYIWGDDEKRLPTDATAYNRGVRQHEPVSPGKAARLYPTDSSVYEFFSSMNEAWRAAGFHVETVMRKVAHHTITPEVHERLRVVYQYQGQKRQRRPQGVPTVRELAEEVGVSKKILCDYAARQGWVTPKEKPWTRAELRLLDKYAHLSPAMIQRHLKAAGCLRSEMGIRVMRTRRKAHKGSPYYSSHAMTQLFGIDSHTLDRVWLRKYPDELKYELKGERQRRQAGDIKLFHVDTIRQFVINHPEEIDLRKVDKMWFLWLVTEGKVKLVVSERLGKRTEGYQPHLQREHRNFEKTGPRPAARA